MNRTIEAEIDERGNARLLEPVQLPSARGALVTILDTSLDAVEGVSGDTARLSESALAQDWNRPEEDRAWAHLQPVR